MRVIIDDLGDMERVKLVLCVLGELVDYVGGLDAVISIRCMMWLRNFDQG